MTNEKLTLAEAAEIAHLAAVTLRKAAQAGLLKAEKIGPGRRATWYVTRADLDAYLASRSRKGSNE